jgi:Flp pilus assembly pilin Flp
MVNRFRRLLDALARPRSGQTLVDYGAVLVFVSIASIAVFVLTGENLNALYNTWIVAVAAALGTAP